MFKGTQDDGAHLCLPRESNAALRLRDAVFFLGAVDAMLTMLSHSRCHSVSLYTKPAWALSCVCCQRQRRHSAAWQSLLVRNACRALRRVSRRSWNPHMPAIEGKHWVSICKWEVTTNLKNNNKLIKISNISSLSNWIYLSAVKKLLIEAESITIISYRCNK